MIDDELELSPHPIPTSDKVAEIRLLFNFTDHSSEYQLSRPVNSMNVENAVQEPPGLPAVILAPTISLLPYNISLNFSSLLALFPSTGLLTRLRRGMSRNGGEEVQFPSTGSTIEWSLETLTQAPQAEATGATGGPAVPIDPFPGPWGFFTSWYMLGLFLMAVVLHRIQNVIIPSRGPQQRRQRHAYRSATLYAPRFQIIQRIYEVILPLDFSKTTTRFILHLPSAYFLCRMLLVWVLLLIQTSEIHIPLGLGQIKWITSLAQWSNAKDMQEICWNTFCAVCAAFLVEGFVKALDGMGSGFPLGSSNSNTSPFNLVSYAFLLHVYSSSSTHVFKPSDDGPSRPDKHILITLAIPLLQLTLFHLLSISKRLSTHRLLPTALSSVLSLLHFHTALFSYYRSSHVNPVSSPSTDTSTIRSRRSLYMNYPVLNYLPNVFETLLLSTIFLTVFLNAFAQLLVRGRIDRVLSGLGIGQGSTLHGDDASFWDSLPLEEDFSILLLRVGIASLEATGLRGWGNEVAPISLPVKARLTRKIKNAALGAPPTHGTVRIGRMEVGEVQYGTYTTAPTASASTSAFAGPLFKRSPRMLDDNMYADQSATRRRRAVIESEAVPVQRKYRRGFNNEVRTVDLGNSEGTAQRRRGSTMFWRWLRELYSYLSALLGVLRGLFVFLIDHARGRVRHKPENTRTTDNDVVGQHNEGGHEPGSQNLGSDKLEEEIHRWQERTLYQRFLKGEDITDDEEDVEDTSSESDDIEGADSEEDVGVDEAEDEPESEAIALFTDLIRNGGSSTSATGRDSRGGEMVLAHLMHGGGGHSAGPLTRRRWNTLFRAERSSDDEFSVNGDERDVSEVSASGRTIFDGDANAEQVLENACVICTSEQRDVICWPCRCLAMCDNCREALASKSAPTKHRCPCCRQPVEGYSKIYVP